MMPEQQVAVATFDVVSFLWSIAPQLISFGGTIGAFIVFGKKIKSWIIDECITNAELETYLYDKDKGKIAKLKNHYDKEIFELKDYVNTECGRAALHAAEQLQNHKEQTTSADRADKKWLEGLQQRIEKLQIDVASLGKK